MKSRILWSLGLVLAALLFAGGSPQEASSEVTNNPAVLQPEANMAVAPATANQEAATGGQTEEADLAEAAVKPISTEKPLPPSIKPAGPLVEVIKLADSGVDEGVMMAFVTNSTSPFNLGVEEILYLDDIGVSGLVVTAMMQRDQALKELFANGAPAPASQFALEPGPPTQYAPQPAAAPAPPEMAPGAAPPADYASENYPPPPAADAGYSTFYGSLAPYGTWVDVAGYGPCWQPTVVIANPVWQPYCDGGRWVYTDCGWYWLSGYSWGWAPFHYGRWFQHNRLGWCWAPDTVWGPSWVCWRYSGSYCGWAPLPPGAWYRAGAGLTFRGHAVSGTVGFGLGVKSYAFVDVNHFRDHPLNRHVLPPQQAAQVYNRTTVSATIVGNNSRVINSGIPVGQVAAATRTAIHTVAIREMNIPAARGARGERFEGNSRTLSVFRPQFPQSTGTQPGSGGRSRSELRNGGSGPAAATKFAAPLILHGPDRPGQGITGSSAGAGAQAFPPNSLIVRGRNSTSRWQTPSPSSALASDAPQSRPTVPRQDTFSRPAVTQRSHPFMTADAQAPSPPRWSVPRATEPPVRAERPWQSAAPSYQAPVQVPRSAPAPAPAPQPMHSFSPPTVSPAPHVQAMEFHQSYSPPSAPAASASGGHSHSSSDRNGR